MDQNFEIYDKTKLGKLIAWGGEHFVYEYGSDEVIKFSILAWLIGKRGADKVIRDCEICSQELGNYFLPTRIATSANGKHLAIIQKKIVGRYFTKKDLTEASLKKQFQEIISAFNSLLVNKKLQIDLVGTRGALTGKLTNIFVTSEEKLVIIDGTLIEFEGAFLFYPVLWVIRKIAEYRQLNVLKKYNR